MDNHNDEHRNNVNYLRNLLRALLIGGLAGAGTMLLLAPQSGKKTRAQIQQKSIELRDQAAETMEDAVAQGGVKARQIRADVHKVRRQAEALQQRGQVMLDEQRSICPQPSKLGKRRFKVPEADLHVLQGEPGQVRRYARPGQAAPASVQAARGTASRAGEDVDEGEYQPM